MQKWNWAALVLVVLGLAGALMGIANRVQAHESRPVGPYNLRVGWQNEPALAGQLNAISLTVSINDKPVKAVEKTVKVTVSTDGKTSEPFTLTPSDETEGLYSVALIPTRVGDYQFHFVGGIGDTRVDEIFDSAQGKFDGVEPTTDLQFPEKDPSLAELQRQIDALKVEIATMKTGQSAATPAR